MVIRKILPPFIFEFRIISSKSPKWNQMQPDMFKNSHQKFPGAIHFPLRFTFIMIAKTCSLSIVPSVYLCISDNKQLSLLVDVMNPVHHASSSLAFYIPSFQFFFWLLHQNIVSLMDQKRIHTAPTDHHADFFSLFYQIFQYRDINVICNLSHSSNTSPCS